MRKQKHDRIYRTLSKNAYNIQKPTPSKSLLWVETDIQFFATKAYEKTCKLGFAKVIITRVKPKHYPIINGQLNWRFKDTKKGGGKQLFEKCFSRKIQSTRGEKRALML